ncbi:MAG: DMT family transporter [Thiothrix sp.]|nr:DMT family transporter [Thiothrix sp.]
MAGRFSLSEHALADLALVLVTLIASLGWFFSSEALTGMPPLLFIALRFLFSGLLLLMLGWRGLRGRSRRELLAIVPAGLAFAGGMMCWILGLQYSTHMGIGAFILSLNFLLVPLLGLLFGERPGLMHWLALPVALVGVACLLLEDGFVFGPGEFYIALSALLFALFLNLNSTAARRIPALGLVAVQQLMVAVVVLPLSLLFEGQGMTASLAVWGWLMASVLLSTSGRFVLQTWAQGRTSASNVALILVLEPVWVALLGLFWLGQGMSMLQLLGCALIFSAVLLGRSKAILVRMRAVPARSTRQPV